MVAEQVARLRQGSNQHAPIGACSDTATQNEAAKLLNVGRRSVQHARTVRTSGTPNQHRPIGPSATQAEAAKLLNVRCANWRRCHAGVEARGGRRKPAKFAG